MEITGNATRREPWNKGKIVGQKAPFRPKDIWALRGCGLVALRVRDVCHGDQLASRAIVMRHKTQRPVQFEITQPTAMPFRRGSSRPR